MSISWWLLILLISLFFTTRIYYYLVELNEKLACVFVETNIVNTIFTFNSTYILRLYLLCDYVLVLSCHVFSLSIRQRLLFVRLDSHVSLSNV